MQNTLLFGISMFTYIVSEDSPRTRSNVQVLKLNGLEKKEGGKGGKMTSITGDAGY